MTDKEAVYELLDPIMVHIPNIIQCLSEAQKQAQDEALVKRLYKWMGQLNRMCVEMQDESDRLDPVPLEELKEFMTDEEIAEMEEKYRNWGII